MLTSKNTNLLPKLPDRTFQEQMRRREISPAWRPAGFKRYAQTAAQLNEMPVIGMSGDVGYDPARFAQVGPLENENSMC